MQTRMFLNCSKIYVVETPVCLHVDNIRPRTKTSYILVFGTSVLREKVSNVQSIES